MVRHGVASHGTMPARRTWPVAFWAERIDHTPSPMPKPAAIASRPPALGDDVTSLIRSGIPGALRVCFGKSPIAVCRTDTLDGGLGRYQRYDVLHLRNIGDFKKARPLIGGTGVFVVASPGLQAQPTSIDQIRFDVIRVR